MTKMKTMVFEIKEKLNNNLSSVYEKIDNTVNDFIQDKELTSFTKETKSTVGQDTRDILIYTIVYKDDKYKVLV